MIARFFRSFRKQRLEAQQKVIAALRGYADVWFWSSGNAWTLCAPCPAFT